MGLRDRVKRLSSSTEEIDQVRLQDRFCDVDCTSIADASERARVVISGEVKAIQVVPVGDGTGKAVAVFTGRRRIGGLEPGRAVLLEGVAGSQAGRLQLMNPAYTLLG